MIFKVSRSAYAGGNEYIVSHHDSGAEFYRGPSVPEVIYEAMGSRPVVHFDWGYDEATNSVDLVGGEVPAPVGE